VRIEPMAKVIAGPCPARELLDLARKVAEAQVEVIRVRLVKADRQSRAGSNSGDCEVLSKDIYWKEALKIMFRLNKKTPSATPEECFSNLFRHLDDSFDDLKCVKDWRRFGPDFEVIERYERRAISRRKFAIRAFDAEQAALARERCSKMA